MVICSRFLCARNKFVTISSTTAWQDRLNARTAAMDAAALAATNTTANAATAHAIADAIAAVLINMQPLAAQVAPMQAPPVWSGTPALRGGTVLDYQNVPGGAKIFKDNTTKLDTTFSLPKPNVTTLITTELIIHSEMSSWNQLMAITVHAINMNFLKA
jgi:hypothetical protein